MKWEIKVFIPANKIENWWKIHIENDVYSHLTTRKRIASSDKPKIEFSDGLIYQLQFNFEDSMLSIEVELIKPSVGHINRYATPPIIFLIEDYFKINTLHFFYLETINDKEINAINSIKRKIEPLQIIDKIKELELNQALLKPSLELLSRQGSFNVDFYSGFKKDFRDITTFWISFLSWVSCSEFEFTNLNYILRRGFFDSNCGSCIPVKPDTIPNELDYMKSKIEWVESKQIQGIHLMKKKFDDLVYLIDFGNRYLIYHCWTNE